MAEDGFRLDRLLLTNDPNYTPSGAGPAESEQQGASGGGPLVLLERTIVYTYDNLYRLTGAITDSPRIECGEHGFLGWTDGLIHFAEIIIHSTIEGDCAKLTAR
jgi:hypothetical protein